MKRMIGEVALTAAILLLCLGAMVLYVPVAALYWLFCKLAPEA